MKYKQALLKKIINQDIFTIYPINRIEDVINLSDKLNEIDNKFANLNISDIKDFPTALPANGGDADTVNGKKANDFAKYEKFAPIYTGNILGIIEMGTYSCYGGDCTNLPTSDLNWWFVTMTQFRDSGYKEFIARCFNSFGNEEDVYKANEFNISNETLNWKKINDGGNAKTVGDKDIEGLCRYYSLKKTDEGTDINNILVTGVYRCESFINYPSSCKDGQGILRVENYLRGNIVSVGGEVGTNDMLIKQYFTSPHDGKTYERYYMNKSLSKWKLIGNESDYVMKTSLYSPTSSTHSNWVNNDTTGNIIPTMNMLTYWNGAYNSSNNSNLQYCKQGAFGNIVTKNAGDYATSSHNHNGDSLNPRGIEFLSMQGWNHGGYLDFHYDGDTSDYTSRIIENSKGNINVDGDMTVGGAKLIKLISSALSELPNEEITNTSSNNYICLNVNGAKLKIAYGRFNIHSGEANIKYGTTFSSIPIVLVQEVRNNDIIATSNITNSVVIFDKSTSNFNIRRVSRNTYDICETNVYVDWFAIGLSS